MVFSGHQCCKTVELSHILVVKSMKNNVFRTSLLQNRRTVTHFGREIVEHDGSTNPVRECRIHDSKQVFTCINSTKHVKKGCFCPTMRVTRAYTITYYHQNPTKKHVKYTRKFSLPNTAENPIPKITYLHVFLKTLQNM